MPATDTKREYTADQTTAYEAYLSAVAEHNIICARPAATTREKMDAATAQMNAFRRFCEVAGFSDCIARSPADVGRIEELRKEINALAESARSAWSMIRAADGMGVIEHHAEGVSRDDHDACVCLIQDAEVVLRLALAKVGA